MSAGGLDIQVENVEAKTVSAEISVDSTSVENLEKKARQAPADARLAKSVLD